MKKLFFFSLIVISSNIICMRASRPLLKDMAVSVRGTSQPQRAPQVGLFTADTCSVYETRFFEEKAQQCTCISRAECNDRFKSVLRDLTHYLLCYQSTRRGVTKGKMRNYFDWREKRFALLVLAAGCKANQWEAHSFMVPLENACYEGFELEKKELDENMLKYIHQRNSPHLKLDK